MDAAGNAINDVKTTEQQTPPVPIADDKTQNSTPPAPKIDITPALEKNKENVQNLNFKKEAEPKKSVARRKKEKKSKSKKHRKGSNKDPILVDADSDNGSSKLSDKLGQLTKKTEIVGTNDPTYKHRGVVELEKNVPEPNAEVYWDRFHKSIVPAIVRKTLFLEPEVMDKKSKQKFAPNPSGSKGAKKLGRGSVTEKIALIDGQCNSIMLMLEENQRLGLVDFKSVHARTIKLNVVKESAWARTPNFDYDRALDLLFKLKSALLTEINEAKEKRLKEEEQHRDKKQKVNKKEVKLAPGKKRLSKLVE